MAVVASVDIASRLLARRAAGGSTGAGGAGSSVQVVHTADGVAVRVTRTAPSTGGADSAAPSAAAIAAAAAVAAEQGGRQWGGPRPAAHGAVPPDVVVGRGRPTTGDVGGVAAGTPASPPPKVGGTPGTAGRSPASAAAAAAAAGAPRPPAAAIVHAVRAAVLAGLEARLRDAPAGPPPDAAAAASSGGLQPAPPLLVGLESQQAEVAEFVESVAGMGENRSMFLVGPASCGKSATLRQALDAVNHSATAAATPLRVVWLEAELIADDAAAMRQITRQLAVDVRVLEAQAAAAADAAATAAASLGGATRRRAASSVGSDDSDDGGYGTEDADASPVDGGGAAVDVVGMLAATAAARAAAAAHVAESPATAAAAARLLAQDSSGGSGGGGGGGAGSKRRSTGGPSSSSSSAPDEKRPRLEGDMRRKLAALQTRAGRWSSALYAHARAVVAAQGGQTTTSTRLCDDDVAAVVSVMSDGLTALEQALGSRAFAATVNSGGGDAFLDVSGGGPAAPPSDAPATAAPPLDTSIDLDTSGMLAAPAGGDSGGGGGGGGGSGGGGACGGDGGGKTAAQAASAALRQGRVKLGYINRHAHVNHLLFLAEALRDGGRGAAAPVLIVISNIDLFAQSTRQTLLYNLLDATASPHARLAMVGLSARVDVVELLEKRLKSRFSHRVVSFPRPPLPAAFRLLNAAAAFPPSLAATHGSYARAWAEAVAKTVASPRFGLVAAVRSGGSVRALLGRLAAAVHAVSPDTPVPTPGGVDAVTCVGAGSGLPVDAATMRLATLPQLSTPQLCLLATMAHIELRTAREEGASAAGARGSGGGAAIAGGVAGARLAGLYNFDIVYHEMACGMRGHGGSIVGEAFAAAAAEAGAGGLAALPVGDDADPNVAAYCVGRDAALLAHAQLVALDLVRLGPRGVSTTALATAGSTVGGGGATAPGPAAYLWDDAAVADTRAELPYLPCKLLVEPAALLAALAAPPAPLAATSAVLAWLRASSKSAPSF